MEYDLEKRLGFLISEVGRLCGKRFDDLATASLGLTRAQCRLMAYLAHYGDMNQVRLAQLLDVAPISAGRLIERMEAGGWVERSENPADRRELQVRLTARAREVLVATRRVGDEMVAEALAGFTAEEAALFSAMLQRVRGNLAPLVERGAAQAT
jgi:DNA-binding MarR family transcriptional regulator